MTQKESGEFLKYKREEIGLSVEEVSSVLKCDPSHLLNIESGEDLPSEDELSVLKHIFSQLPSIYLASCLLYSMDWINITKRKKAVFSNRYEDGFHSS